MNKLLLTIPIIVTILLSIMLSMPVVKVKAYDDLADKQLKAGNKVDFDYNPKTGVTVWSEHKDKTTAASASRVDSAAGATSTNNVQCFAFCFGTSTANAASGAKSDNTSDNRIDSPSNTATVTQSPPLLNHRTELDPSDPLFKTIHSSPKVTHTTTAVTTAACLDIQSITKDAGDRVSAGFQQGYADAQRHWSSGSGFDNDPGNNGAKHTVDFAHGYRDGYSSGWHDASVGMHSQPC